MRRGSSLILSHVLGQKFTVNLDPVTVEVCNNSFSLSSLECKWRYLLGTSKKLKGKKKSLLKVKYISKENNSCYQGAELDLKMLA